MENVIALPFATAEQAAEAVRALQDLHRSGEIRLEAAAVVQRSDDGGAVALDHGETSELRGTAGGGVIGALIGLFAGPFGLLLGGATGAVVGSLVDAADAESSEDVLRWLARAIPEGHTAAIIVVEEPTPAAVDALASERGVTVLRRDRAAVELEIATAEEDAIASAGDDDGKGPFGDRLTR